MSVFNNVLQKLQEKANQETELEDCGCCDCGGGGGGGSSGGMGKKSDLSPGMLANNQERFRTDERRRRYYMYGKGFETRTPY